MHDYCLLFNQHCARSCPGNGRQEFRQIKLRIQHAHLFSTSFLRLIAVNCNGLFLRYSIYSRLSRISRTSCDSSRLLNSVSAHSRILVPLTLMSTSLFHDTTKKRRPRNATVQYFGTCLRFLL